jgi:hypothetical protein
MQKLITVCLHQSQLQHGSIEEHMLKELSEGWRITSLSSTVSQSEMLYVSVVLELSEVASSQSEAAMPTMLPSNISPPRIEFPKSSEGRPVQPTDIPVTEHTPLEIGSRVLAFSQGRWWRAEIVGFEGDDLVHLHFPGWDDKWDLVVPREELQVDIDLESSEGE